jgi:hypothetical protein
MKHEAPPPVNRVAASSGLAWLLQSLTLLKRQAGALLLIAVLMQLLMSLTRLPLFGFLVVLALPALTAGVLEAFDMAAKGTRPRIAVLFRPLTTAGRSASLFGLGALLFLVGVVTAAIVLSGGVEQLDPATLQRLEQGEVAALSEIDPAFIRRMLVAFALGMAVSGTLSYFAIPLVWFHAMPMWAALGLGVRALMKNWLPFVVLTLCLAVVMIPLGLVGSFVLQLAGGEGIGSSIAMALLLLLALALQMVLFGTQYCSARQVFQRPRPSAPTVESEPEAESTPDPDDDQFVA